MAMENVAMVGKQNGSCTDGKSGNISVSFIMHCAWYLHPSGGSALRVIGSLHMYKVTLQVPSSTVDYTLKLVSQR